jgi:hypothetical protein
MDFDGNQELTEKSISECPARDLRTTNDVKVDVMMEQQLVVCSKMI